MTGGSLRGWEVRYGSMESADTSRIRQDIAAARAAIENAPPHQPCPHVISPKALYRPGIYVCASCAAPVEVPFPLSERTIETPDDVLDHPATVPLPPCAPCVEYQRGERDDIEWAGMPVHACEWIERDRFDSGPCPCGCDLGDRP